MTITERIEQAEVKLQLRLVESTHLVLTTGDYTELKEFCSQELYGMKTSPEVVKIEVEKFKNLLVYTNEKVEQSYICRSRVLKPYLTEKDRVDNLRAQSVKWTEHYVELV